jgi:hypothetical protein
VNLAIRGELVVKIVFVCEFKIQRCYHILQLTYHNVTIPLLDFSDKQGHVTEILIFILLNEIL